MTNSKTTDSGKYTFAPIVKPRFRIVFHFYGGDCHETAGWWYKIVEVPVDVRKVNEVNEFPRRATFWPTAQDWQRF